MLTDNGSEFRSPAFGRTVRELGAPDLHPGRPAGDQRRVERVQRTILEECWRPSFARSLVPKLTGLTRDLAGYLRLLQQGACPHRSADQGRTPYQALVGARKMRPR